MEKSMFDNLTKTGQYRLLFRDSVLSFGLEINQCLRMRMQFMISSFIPKSLIHMQGITQTTNRGN